MQITAYLKTIPPGNTNPQKPKLLYDFIEGVNKVGDKGNISKISTVENSDVGVIQGWVHDKISSQHLQLRKKIIDTQIQNKKYVVCADANLFLYHNKSNPHGYLRYSFNGVFPNTGIYCDDKIDPGRWTSISKICKISLQDVKKQGNHIVLLVQRNGGWSMAGLDTQTWAAKTVKKIQEHTDRKIIIRTHPGDKRANDYFKNWKGLRNFSNVELESPDKTLDQTLNDAWAVVNHNSSAAVGPIIKGYHCFLTDPIRSQCRDVANTDFNNIENPLIFDREKWLQRISMFHWSFEELRNGSCWKHMRNYVQ